MCVQYSYVDATLNTVAFEKLFTNLVKQAKER